MRYLPSLLAAVLVCGAAPARADFFSQSPGPLAEAHRELDSSDQCGKCHTDGKALSNEKCLACHDPIRRRIAEGRGLHAGERAAGKQCFLCHTDHKGRGRDILGFATVGGRERFDHAITGWPLSDKHARVACAKCHTGRSFLKAPAACEGCHKSPHGDLRPPLKKCERCHDAASWSPLARMDFDHDKPADARFATDVKHAAVPCLKCHEKWVFRPHGGFAAPDCTPCHDNVHGDSLFGKKKCALCHTSKAAWTAVRFDHARQTRFPLEGVHAQKTCATCHTPQSRAKPDKQCTACHKDVHRGRFGSIGDCGSCHGAATWTGDLRFDHRARTRFSLTGKHGEVDCRRCHRGDTPTEWERFDATEIGCMGCHQHQNVHKKQFKDAECLRCHKAAGVNRFKKAAVEQFHGADTRFPLTEGHAKVACEKCHKNDVYQGTPTVCGPACHADDLHKGALGEKCLRCHEGGHWAATRFDHDLSGWPLLGHHQEASCDGCHADRKFKPTPRRCAVCHKQDDAHQGTLGDRCEGCHSPTGRSVFDHNDPKAVGRFRLEGQHLMVRCKACHPTTMFQRAPKKCEGCHGEPKAHLGQLGTACAGCHDASSWRTIRTGHDTAAFKFGGAHDRLRCESCHPGGKPLRGTSEVCVACHRNDDIHHGSLGPRCLDCHTQESFGAPRFFHERVGCDLRGLHRTLPCNDCHTGGHFAAVAPSCVSCHRGDAIRAATSNPKAGGPAHAGYRDCELCHNVNFFVPAPRPAGSGSVCR
ncbi:MAG: hypothetical protein EXR72_22085 [Myxococcales bacterium]|nr:hypothetical protein [Myxococcales bacterium]